MNDLNRDNKKIPSNSIKDVIDIKLLLCYVLYKVDRFMSKDVLFVALKEYDFVNYFDFNDAFAKLLKDGSITKNQEDEDSYSITKKGEIIAKELERKLPLTVREKAIAATINLLARLKREKENSSSIKKANNGYYFSGNISGGGEINLMSFSLYVPDELQAKLIKRNFQNYPEKVYECLLAVLTKNNNMINNILEEIKNDIAENA